MAFFPEQARTPLVTIVGPTGSGKSALGLALAGEFAAEIVNCDSLQLYRGLDIGTAKMPLGQRHNIPHHLLDVLSLKESYSAGEYAREAARIIDEIAARGHLPLLAGGTGFYLQALLEGLPQLPERDEALRARLFQRETLRAGNFHRLLQRLDPDSANLIHASDVQKLMRALEIRILTGKPRSAGAATSPLGNRAVIRLGLDPDREQLRERLRIRSEAMFAAGLLQEVSALLNAGASGGEKPFEALGYKQALAHLRGELTREQAILSTWTATCQYAKRQRTWFRRDPAIFWFDGFGDSTAVRNAASAFLRQQLNSNEALH